MAPQFALTAVKLQMFGAKTRHAKQIGTMNPQRREKKISFDLHVKKIIYMVLIDDIKINDV